ncbi:MAG: hypothetical protein KatS3mg050_2761 [Litorilinea sp.]|nr:MAG: hypothetical protein KatS3mg050_2761 [Litorilinea sp.]
MELLLGIDIGTTNVKAVLATPEGQVIAQASVSYPLAHPRPGWAEQDPADWWQGAVQVVRTLVALIPVLIVFYIAQARFIQGVVITGVKG